MKLLIKETELSTTSKVLSLDAQLKKYYSEEFTVGVITSESKNFGMFQQTYLVKRPSMSMRQIFGYISVAAFIGIASYMSSDSLVDMKLTRNVQIIE